MRHKEGDQLRSSCAERSRLALTLGIAGLILILMHWTPSRAQQLQGLEPGDKDPVGSASNYLTLRTDNLTILAGC